jgi:hypothetical protein
MIAAFAVVPPMSKEITFGQPMRRAMRAHAITPAAGPDSTMLAGLIAAADAVMTPPYDCITRSGASTPRPAIWRPSAPRYCATVRPI